MLVIDGGVHAGVGARITLIDALSFDPPEFCTCTKELVVACGVSVAVDVVAPATGLLKSGATPRYHWYCKPVPVACTVSVTVAPGATFFGAASASVIAGATHALVTTIVTVRDCALPQLFDTIAQNCVVCDGVEQLRQR